jgi:hypothetical protein
MYEEDEVQRRLRLVRPIAPSPELRARIVGQTTGRAWPWAAAAAALLGFSVTLSSATGRGISELQAIALNQPPFDDRLASVKQVLGGDEESIRMATFVVLGENLLERAREFDGQRR